MKKITTAAKKSAPKFVGENRVQVTREFAKNAMIFGTPEYKLWREIKADCPAAEMVHKTIKKNPNKRTSNKNMTYEHMAIYIRQQDNAAIRTQADEDETPPSAFLNYNHKSTKKPGAKV